jgi:hypothetical protein
MDENKIKGVADLKPVRVIIVQPGMIMQSYWSTLIKVARNVQKTMT